MDHTLQIRAREPHSAARSILDLPCNWHTIRAILRGRDLDIPLKASLAQKDP